ncbi:sodium-dependent organic anion transporter-like [Watersipora subatra]|uniref:sodium-dependent organic anion transporter-like n=1 Tax=Watersipora subatra TaxID=2589382 RepID=UPI00355C2B19
MDLKFLNCAVNETEVNLRLILTEGSERNLEYPETIEAVPCRENSTEAGVNETLAATMLGFVTIRFTDDETMEHYLDYSVGVTRPPFQITDQVYGIGIMVLTAVATFTFGLSLEMGKVKGYLKKPVAPAIGIVCQFVLMPMTGFLITLAMTDAHPALKLGIFASATAPGGGLSNMFIYVLDGDVDLSITMTFISTCAALGFLPVWMYTLGQYILKDSGISLPFIGIVQTLALLVVPLTIGVLINRFLPKVAKILLYSQKAIVLLTMFFIMIYGTWVNGYAYRMIFTDVRLCLACFFLPYVGGMLGFCLALIFKQGRQLSLTIAIETAVQNLNVAIILLRESLQQPWADISSAIPIVIIMCTFIPFPFMAAARLIHDRVNKKVDKEDNIEQVEVTKVTHREKIGIDNPVPVHDEKF